jgi:ATP-dependent protease HslVU (ClpYQ) peptidase subunit
VGAAVTCIVGLVEGGTVWIGGDSAGVDPWHQLNVIKGPKVFRNGQMIIGYTSTFRMGQLLEHCLTIPAHHQDVSVDKFMATEFISAVRKCFADNGYIKKTNEREEGGTFLAAYRGRLFIVQDDLSVIECAEGYATCGSGWMVALGALHAAKTLQPADRVRAALQAAEAHVSSVRGPFHVETLTP